MTEAERVPSARNQTAASVGLLPVFGCSATVRSTGLKRMQTRNQPRRGCGSWIPVGELVGVVTEVVELFVAARILHVLRAVARADAAVGGGEGCEDVVSCGFEQYGAPPWSSVAHEHRF